MFTTHTAMRRRSLHVLALLVGLLVLNLELASRAFAAGSIMAGIDPATYTCGQPTFEDFEDLAPFTNMNGQARQGLQYSGPNVFIGDRDEINPLYAMRGSRVLSPFIGTARIDFVYGTASTFSFLTAMDPWVLSYPGQPLVLDAYDAAGTLLESASYDQPYIGTETMLKFEIARPTADIAFVDVRGGENSYLIDAICTDAPNSPVSTATVKFAQPLDPSTTASIVTNKAKAGRTIPVKVELAHDGVEQDASNQATPPTIGVSEIGCSAQTSDAVESYADGGATTSGNAFRWSADAPGFWTYNLDTTAWGMTAGHCYRLDVYLGSTRVTTDSTQWAVVQITK